VKNKRHIHIVSAQTGSIGEITRDLIKALSVEFNVTVELESEPVKYDILLCHFINPIVSDHENFRQFKHKVLIQPIDGTDIEQGFVNQINKYDLVITPANAGKRIMEKCGVTSPIVVIPNYYRTVDIDSFNRIDKDVKIRKIPNNKIVIYHESTFHPRKGIEYMYAAYIKAFSNTSLANKVVLVCKDMPHNKLTMIVSKRLNVLRCKFKKNTNIRPK